MPRIFVISDTHFGHTNIIKGLSKWADKSGCRPFNNHDEHNKALINGWNNVVEDDDIVYHLGDVIFGGIQNLQLVRHLKGKKRLVLGNHDKPEWISDYWDIGFKHIYGWADVGRHATLTHAPIHREHVYSGVNIHGHIHQLDSPKGPYCNVSVEKLDRYEPILIEEAIRRAERNVSS